MSDVFRVSGKKLELKPSGAWKFERRPGGWVIATSPEGQRLRMQLAETRGKLSANVAGTLWFGEISQTRQGGVAAAGSDADLVAQFPGKVRKILVEAGRKVAEGEPLLLVEAMKMEFSIKAPSDGTVTKVHVAEGQQLSPGTKFLDFEATS